jgi:hypothetical protein
MEDDSQDEETNLTFNEESDQKYFFSVSSPRNSIYSANYLSNSSRSKSPNNEKSGIMKSKRKDF